MKTKFYKLTENDLDTLIKQIRLYEEVFEMEDFAMPPPDYLQMLLRKEHIVFYAAIAGDDEVIGGLTAYILPSVYFAASEIYIYDLAVKSEYQRKGIGTRLIAGIKDYGKTLGYKDVFVQADLEDQHAVDFYQATGGQSANVIHFSYNLTDE